MLFIALTAYYTTYANNVNINTISDEKKDVEQLVIRAENLAKHETREQAAYEFSSKEISSHGHYVFALVCDDDAKNDGFFIANPATPNLNFQQRASSPIVQDVMTTGRQHPNGHWIQYCWPNPATGKNQIKHSYIVMLGSKKMCIGSGFYENTSCHLTYNCRQWMRQHGTLCPNEDTRDNIF